VPRPQSTNELRLDDLYDTQQTGTIKRVRTSQSARLYRLSAGSVLLSQAIVVTSLDDQCAMTFIVAQNNVCSETSLIACNSDNQLYLRNARYGDCFESQTETVQNH